MTMATLIKGKKLIRQCQRFSSLSSWWDTAGHGSVQADMVPEKELRVLRLNPQAMGSGLCHTRCSLSIRDLKACPHSDTLPPTRPHLLIVPLPLGAIFFQTSTDSDHKDK